MPKKHHELKTWGYPNLPDMGACDLAVLGLRFDPTQKTACARPLKKK